MRKRLVLVLALVMVIPSIALAGNRFNDVASGGTHHDSIGWMANNGITVGCNIGGTEFCPDDVVTRAQMATFMYRLSGNAPGVQPSVNAANSLLADAALTADRADNADNADNADHAENSDLLDGFPKENFQSLILGNEFDLSLGYVIDEDPVPLQNWSGIGTTDQSTLVEVGFKGILQLVSAELFLANDYFIACWISTSPEIAFDFDTAGPSLVLLTLELGKNGIATAEDNRHYYPISMTHRVVLAPGEFSEFYVYCEDLFADDFPGGERFFLTAVQTFLIASEIDSGSITAFSPAQSVEVNTPLSSDAPSEG